MFKKIVFLGASLTEGVYGASYVDALRRRLPKGYDLVNKGVGGSTMNRLLERLESALDDENPDAVLILAGTNDAIAYSQPKTRPYYKSVQGLPEGFIPPDEYEQMLREALTQIQLAHIQPLIGLPPMEYNPALVEASHLFNEHSRRAARAFNAPVCDLARVMNPPEIVDRPPLDMKIIFTIGERTQSGWKDYDAERQAGGYTYSFDGMHYTQDAADQTADLLAPFIVEHVPL